MQSSLIFRRTEQRLFQTMLERITINSKLKSARMQKLGLSSRRKKEETEEAREPRTKAA